MQGTTSNAIIQVLRLYSNYGDNTFCYSHIGGSFCCNYAIRNFCSTYASGSFCIEYVDDNFIVFMQVGVSAAVMQVVLSAVHNCFCCKMQVTVPVIAMQATLSSNSFILLSLNGTHFS